jgi:hypothetical protein
MPSKFGRRIQFLEREIEFIQWWRMRQGQIAPFLSFDIEECDCRSLDLKLTSDSMPFLLEYISSAQYLELGLFFWNLIQQTIQAGHQLVFPNLYTVLLERTYSSKDSQAFYRIQSGLPAHAFPTLRRLSISEVAPANDFAIPAHWSTLTHISLNSISISLDFWLSFIRAVPNIQWGSFAIATGALSGIPRPSPPLCTLRELDTLSVYVSARLARSDVFPLSFLFTNLRIPAVHTLSLSAPGAKAWSDVRALRELYAVLDAAPAVAQLALVDLTSSAPAPAIFSPVLKDPVEPLWHHAPALAHLCLTLASAQALRHDIREDFLARFVHALFASDTHWLELRHPACPVRAMTINNTGWSRRISDLMMACIRDSTAVAPQVVLEITQGAPQVALEITQAGEGPSGQTVRRRHPAETRAWAANL